MNSGIWAGQFFANLCGKPPVPWLRVYIARFGCGGQGLIESLVRDGTMVSISGRTLGCPVVATAVYTSVLIPALYIAALAMVPISAGMLC